MSKTGEQDIDTGLAEFAAEREKAECASGFARNGDEATGADSLEDHVREKVVAGLREKIAELSALRDAALSEVKAEKVVGHEAVNQQARRSAREVMAEFKQIDDLRAELEQIADGKLAVNNGLDGDLA